MRKRMMVLSIFCCLAGTLSAENAWFVNDLSGSDINNGLTPTSAKKSISGLFASGILNDGDTINIAAGTYVDHPTISKNVVINGYTLGLSRDIMFNLTAGNMNFTMPGTTKFALNDIPAFGIAGATRFYFYGSDTTGMIFQTGKVLLATATFQFESPFMFQTPKPPQTNVPSTWYVDDVTGNNELNTGYNQFDARKSITGVAITNQWLDGDVINMAAATYTDGPQIAKNISINGFNANGYTDVTFDLDSVNIVFMMTGRTDFTSYPVGSGLGAFRFYFTGSTTTGIRFKSGCVHLVNTIFYFVPPFLFMSEATSNSGISDRDFHPITFDLQQAYPNPFNPSTVIRFTLGTAAKTSLKVFDLLGNEVATLMDGMLQPGTYEKTFDARGCASGVYFYRLNSGNAVQSKKLILLR